LALLPVLWLSDSQAAIATASFRLAQQQGWWPLLLEADPAWADALAWQQLLQALLAAEQARLPTGHAPVRWEPTEPQGATAELGLPLLLPDRLPR